MWSVPRGYLEDNWGDRQIARRVLLLENSSAVSAQWRHGVSAEISKLMKIRLRGSTSLTVVVHLSLILH
jgi:hypothetical protein